MRPAPLLVAPMIALAVAVPVGTAAAQGNNPEAPEAAKKWAWSGPEDLSDASYLETCAKNLRPELDVAYVRTESWPDLGVIRIRRGEKTVLEVPGHSRTALARSKSVVFVAEFSPAASGCAVSAYDLDTGKKLWRTQLEGIGPTAHSEYYNRVQLEVIEEVLVVRGREAHGRYVECLATSTGRAVWHRKLDR